MEIQFSYKANQETLIPVVYQTRDQSFKILFQKLLGGFAAAASVTLEIFAGLGNGIFSLSFSLSLSTLCREVEEPVTRARRVGRTLAELLSMLHGRRVMGIVSGISVLAFTTALMVLRQLMLVCVPR